MATVPEVMAVYITWPCTEGRASAAREGGSGRGGGSNRDSHGGCGAGIARGTRKGVPTSKLLVEVEDGAKAVAKTTVWAACGVSSSTDGWHNCLFASRMRLHMQRNRQTPHKSRPRRQSRESQRRPEGLAAGHGRTHPFERSPSCFRPEPQELALDPPNRGGPARCWKGTHTT